LLALQCVKGCLFIWAEVRRHGAETPAAGHDEQHDQTNDQQPRRRKPQQQRMALDARPQQDELAVTIDQELPHLFVGIAGSQPLAHQDADILGEVRIAVIDRFVLADEAPQFGGDIAGALFQPRIGQHFIRVNRQGHRRNRQQQA
jgi:hypothetical protein